MISHLQRSTDIGCILNYFKFSSPANLTLLKIVGYLLVLMQVGGFLYSTFLFLLQPLRPSVIQQRTPDWGFYLVALGVIIGAITIIIPDKKAKDDADD
jgi:hypothetical protein